jgi:hypothetical protein
MPMLNLVMLLSRLGWLIWAYVVRLDQRAEVDAVESFHWTVKDGVVDVVDGGGELVSSDGEDEAVGSPCFARGDVDGA